MFDTPDPIATTAGYQCRYYPTIMSGPVFRWTLGDNDRFEVSASRDAVMVVGHSPGLGKDGVARLTEVLNLAARVHWLLKPGRDSVDAAKELIRLHHTTE